jgi:radical SAM-linked protein
VNGPAAPNTQHRSEKVQRLRVRFARGPEAAEIGHLDLTRCWERAFCEAGIAVSYSQGNRPQPRIAIAAGLPMGVTSEGELLDVTVAERTDPAQLAERVQPHLPPGLAAREVREVGMGLPSLSSAVRWADYEVDVPAGDEREVAAAIEPFLAAERFHWIDKRGEKTREYDLRALVQELRVGGAGDGITRLSMRLRCDAAGVGRPDQVVKALGLPQALRIHRVGLALAEASPAREAWRRRGRFLN